MKRFKKTLKLLGFIVLIVFASIGLGLAGGAPLISTNKRNEPQQIKIELVESVQEENLSENEKEEKS